MDMDDHRAAGADEGAVNPAFSFFLHLRQVSTHLTFHELHGLWDTDMPTAGEYPKLLTNAWRKTNE